MGFQESLHRVRTFRSISANSLDFHALKFLMELFSVTFRTKWLQSQPPNVKRNEKKSEKFCIFLAL